MRTHALLAATALLAAASAPAAVGQTQQQRALGTEAQTGSPPPTNPSAPAAGLGSAATRGDALTVAGFARTAAMSDMFEIESSRLAEQRSQDAQVKQFAQHMIRDHQKTTSELKGLLPQLQGAAAAPQLPTSLDQQHQALVQQLQGAQGAEFDRTFVRQQVQAHQTAVDLFRAYAQSGDNAQLKQWASQTLPSLEEHLRQAQQMQRAH
jgi:putative membrane protein